MTFIKNYLNWLSTTLANLTIDEKYMILTALLILIFFVLIKK